MAANLPGTMVGTAPDASYILARTEDHVTEFIIEEYNWVSGAEFADSAGADILTTSLGYYAFNDPSQDHTYENLDGNTTPITIGADIAASRGLAVMNSAGNSGQSAWYYITPPADGDSVFTIGGVDANEVLKMNHQLPLGRRCNQIIEFWVHTNRVASYGLRVAGREIRVKRSGLQIAESDEQHSGIPASQHPNLDLYELIS